MSRKTGLLPGPVVSKTHFSNNTSHGKPIPVPHSKLVVRILDAKSLLASDLETGKSDPVCFIWYGPSDEHPSIESMTNGEQSRVLQTSVCPTTTDPIWDEELVFPIDMSTIKLADLVNFYCYIYVADYDEMIDAATQETAVSYDSLGQLTIPFGDIVDQGKCVNGNSLALGMKSYAVEKAPPLRR
jgi:hypothetical protein